MRKKSQIFNNNIEYSVLYHPNVLQILELKIRHIKFAIVNLELLILNLYIYILRYT